jgi:hypothetical protein
MTKSATATPGRSEGQVSTVKIDGSYTLKANVKTHVSNTCTQRARERERASERERERESKRERERERERASESESTRVFDLQYKFGTDDNCIDDIQRDQKKQYSSC